MRLPLILLAATTVSATAASAATELYVGPAAAFATAVPAGAGSNNARADTIPSLTYIFTTTGTTFATGGRIRVDQVNLAVQDAGSVTPFLALYTGGPLDSGASYTLLATGDTFAVSQGTSDGVLVNAAFTVGGTAPVLFLASGSTLVAGAYQSGDQIVFQFTNASQTLIDRGDTVPAASGGTFPAGRDFYFNNQDYRFNIGYSAVVPEPASWALLVAGFGLVGTAARRRQLRPA